LKDGKSNYPMALDEADHRIFVVTRRPARLVVIDSDTGATVASVPCVNDADDVYYDTGRKRNYVPEGRASSPLSSKRMQIITRHWQKFQQPLERTGLWYEKRDRFYLAVPASSKEGAALWVYAPED
jgi:hypothetical protein